MADRVKIDDLLKLIGQTASERAAGNRSFLAQLRQIPIVGSAIDRIFGDESKAVVIADGKLDTKADSDGFFRSYNEGKGRK